MIAQKRALTVLLLIMTALLAACGQGSGADDAIAAGVAATQTRAAWEAGLESARLTEEAVQPEPTPEPEIIHVDLPAEPAEISNTYVTDVNSIDYAEEGIAYGDQFLINRFERPFTAEMAEYRGYLDLILANMKVNPPWIYVDIYLADRLPEAAGAFYSLEFDTDEDGRGDYLIRAALPQGTDWSTAGVSVFEDADGDVGGENPVLADPPLEDAAGTGFEAVLFQEGRGDDPDLAWARRNPLDETSLQIAFKGELLGPEGFLWAVWADEGLRDPGLADYNDRFSFEQAGSPFPEHQYYPIQAIALVDSTCRSWYGFEPAGDELGICQVYMRGTGYKVCYSYNVGATTLTVCDSVCQEKCPEGLPTMIGGMRVFCQKCNMPEE